MTCSRLHGLGDTAGALEGNIGQIGMQFVGIAATVVWIGIASAVILFIIDKTVGLRVDEESKADGIDFSQHRKIAR